MGGRTLTRVLRRRRVSNYWTTRSLTELIQEQSVDGVVDIKTLQNGSISDEEAEAFITVLRL